MLKKAFLLAGRAGIKSVVAVLLICIGVSSLSGCGMISLIAANGLAGNNVQPNFSDKQTQTEGTAPKDELKQEDELEPPDDEAGNQTIPAPDISEAVDTAEKNAKTYMVDAIPASNCTIDRIEIQSFSDSITQKGEKKRYTINTVEAGTYRFEFSDIPQDIKFSLYLYNSNMEQLQKATYCSNGYGMTAELKASNVYYLDVVQAHNVGSYTLNFGFQKPMVSVGQYTSIADSTQYTDQRNIYQFNTDAAGVYRFEFSNIPQNIQFSLYLYNSNMEQLQKATYCSNGYGITAELGANAVYYLHVVQAYNVGSYTLNFGFQKPTCDVSGYNVICDSIQYTDQKNNYRFVPETSAVHEIAFSMSGDARFTLYVYNSYMEQLAKEAYRGDGDGLSIELGKGEIYYIVVAQKNGMGRYDLNIQTQ